MEIIYLMVKTALVLTIVGVLLYIKFQYTLIFMRHFFPIYYWKKVVKEYELQLEYMEISKQLLGLDSGLNMKMFKKQKEGIYKALQEAKQKLEKAQAQKKKF